MRFHWQNLNRDSRRSYLLHGRAWLWRLCFEWCIPMGSCSWGVTIGGGDSGRDLGFTVCLPFLASFYLTIPGFFPRRLFDYNFDRGDDRQISVSIHDYALWYHIWVGSMASWGRDYPWCRWWRQGNFHFANLLGKQHYETHTPIEGVPVLIAMPEGVYSGTAKVEFQRWKRPLWFARERYSTWIDVPKGIPFAGKGENSWDCGDDGLFGAGVSGIDVRRACEHFAEIVRDNRKRHGMPSDEAISMALQTES